MEVKEALNLLENGDWFQAVYSTLSQRKADEVAEAINTVANTIKHAHDREPMTLEQLRGMERHTPVWAEVENKTIEGWDGYWCLCRRGKILTPSLIVVRAEDLEGVKFYAYPPAHIDREAWGECAYCSSIPHMEGVEMQPCASGYIGCEVSFGKCRDDEKVGMVVYYRNAAAGYVDFDFCPFCGKPQTEAAWSELEKRLRG